MLIKNIAKFLSALATHWVALMSGLASALTALWLHLKHKPNITDKWFWITAAVCLFFACFLAWSDQYRIRLSAEAALAEERDNTRPKFVFTLSDAAIVYSEKLDSTLVFPIAKIVNQGGESAAGPWRAYYKSPTLNSRVDIAMMSNESRVVVPLPGGGVEIRTKDTIIARLDYLIPRGGHLFSRVPIQVRGNRLKELEEGAVITVEVEDFMGKVYEARYQASGTGFTELLPTEKMWTDSEIKGKHPDPEVRKK